MSLKKDHIQRFSNYPPEKLTRAQRKKGLRYHYRLSIFFLENKYRNSRGLRPFKKDEYMAAWEALIGTFFIGGGNCESFFFDF